MKHLYNSIRLNGYAVPLLLCITIFVQVVLFQWFCYHNLLLTSLWKAPDHFLVFWLSKIGIALFFASFALLFKRKWWTVAIVALVSLWSVSNLIYYRANNMLLSVAAITMADNLNGFQSSIRAYWNLQSTILVLIPFLYTTSLVFCQPSQRRKCFTFAILIAVIIIGDITLRYTYNRLTKNVSSCRITTDDIIPYRHYYNDLYWFFRINSATNESNGDNYVSYYSILANIPRISIYHHITSAHNRLAANMRISKIPIPETLEQQYNADSLCENYLPKCNLIVMLVESLESWVIGIKDDSGREVAPHLSRLTQSSIYFPYCQSQAKEGVSGDGQLIVNTGILPLQQGAACMIFGDNTYPNLASAFNASATIIPTLTTTWNQTVASTSYGYQETVSEGEIEDDALFRLTKRWLDTVSATPFCLQLLTVSTHGPFDRVKHGPLQFNSDIPGSLRDYLKCVHYADSCIGDFMTYLEQRGLLDNSIIVITGDHTVFKDNLLREYRKAAIQHGYDFQSGHNFVPIILLVPNEKSPRLIADTCGQYDIYPTLRGLLGSGRYPWKGLGRDLLDPTSVRPFSEQEAYRWSDVLIRSNWFEDK